MNLDQFLILPPPLLFFLLNPYCTQAAYFWSIVKKSVGRVGVMLQAPLSEAFVVTKA